MVAVSTDQSRLSNDRADTEAFQRLLVLAKEGDTSALGQLLRWYINYLTILASAGLDRRLRRRVNPSDVVQEAMLAAHRDFGGFRGQSQNEMLGWLRQILINTLHRNFAKHVKAEKRDIRREVSLDQVNNRLEESAANLVSLLPGNGDSPSSPMRRREDSMVLADKLGGLPAPYRDVIVYRILQGLSFDEISERMDRSNGAVRMLWLRALEAFKSQGELAHDEG